MTLAACIAAHEAAQPQAIASHAVLSDLGHAVAAAYRLIRIVRELSDSDRATVLDMLQLELDGE